MPTPNARMFGPQHWNAIAKDIRTELQIQIEAYDPDEEKDWIHAQRRAIEELGLRFAARFRIDNESFDPIKFLRQCSPDEAFPLAELWEDNAP